MRKENRVVISHLLNLKVGINELIEEIKKCKPEEIEPILNDAIDNNEELDNGANKLDHFFESIRRKQKRLKDENSKK